ncbi:Receptor-like serine/threonine-protein kinase ALE2 [Sesamum alatum]|uniref:Receptor-like serine/threonine-protein kinase ALE2 n=1 Tax=Sesamum alatum TaxID=300844 RepID=A0AAE1XQI5_9LAMI|nr:Receptor-like serine/threonine-protein kinase ALE2 [Sesamum alatum]
MGMEMLQVLGLVLKLCAFACSMMIQGSAGMSLQSQLIMPPLNSAPVPQTTKSLTFSPWPSVPSVPPPYLLVPPPASLTDTFPAMPPVPPRLKPRHSGYPPFPIQAPGSMSPNSRQTKGHDNNADVSPISPEQNGSPVSTPPPSISQKIAPVPVAAPERRIAHPYAPVSHSQTGAPSASKPPGHPNSAPTPHPFSKSTPGFYSPKKHHHARNYKITPAPLSHIIPPASSKRAPYLSKSDPKANLRRSAPPPTSAGSSPINPKMPLLPPLHALPLPPPRKDCAPLTCTEPLTYGHPGFSCICVLPIQVGLRLTVALYTFFPLVSELAAEVAAGIFIKQSQVRVIGANAAGDNPEKTIVLIDLVPLQEKFDDTSPFLTFERFWHKQVAIKPSLFGDYDVLYVRYPGLPLSPPLPPSTVGIIGSKPYPGHDNSSRTIQPLAVDIRRRQHGNGLSRGMLAAIIVSASVAVALLCAIAWVSLHKNKDSIHQPDPPPPATIRSLAKSSVSMPGSGPGSPSFSLGSTMAAYTGSAKTFSSSDLEKATDYFNESRILGEGGFGRVYSGELEDGTKVAVKILKRYDQQGGREFLAEVEMLSRLHHRNLVKLIGICVEDRTRCLVYELIPNGSVESHLHGIDKETAPLNWSARLKIALGAARALAYLHEDSSPCVIHRDFKASNILLEDDFTPKVSDFGLARTALDGENKYISTRVMGTFGYVAPEYAMTGHLLVKSDVYSYGVVLLELLTGKKPVDMTQPPGQENLVSWARPLLTSREGLGSIVDASLGPDFPFDSIAKVAAIASMCVQPEVSHRPFMGEVVQALKLVHNQCDETREWRSGSCSQEDMSIEMGARNSTISDQLPDHLLTQSPVSNYDYPVDVERNLSMSELLSSSAMFGRQDSETFRRHSSSGPLRTGKGKRLWKMMRWLSGGSVSEHGVPFKFWN